MKVKVLVLQFCLTLCDPIDCIPPGSSVHGIFQARILEWVAIPFSGGSENKLFALCVLFLLEQTFPVETSVDLIPFF